MPRPAVRLSPSTTILGAVRIGVGGGASGKDVEAAGSVPEGSRAELEPPHEIAASIRRERRTRFNPSILLSYTTDRGYHRLPAGAGPRPYRVRARTTRRGHRRAEAGAEGLWPQTRRRGR